MTEHVITDQKTFASTITGHQPTEHNSLAHVYERVEARSRLSGGDQYASFAMTPAEARQRAAALLAAADEAEGVQTQPAASGFKGRVLGLLTRLHGPDLRPDRDQWDAGYVNALRAVAAEVETFKDGLGSDWQARLMRDMRAEARERLGEGYVAEYYADAASGFVGIAESYVRDALGE